MLSIMVVLHPKAESRLNNVGLILYLAEYDYAKEMLK